MPMAKATRPAFRIPAAGRADGVHSPAAAENRFQLGMLVDLHALRLQPALDDLRLGFIQDVAPVAVAAQEVMHLDPSRPQPLDQLQRGDPPADDDRAAGSPGKGKDPLGVQQIVQLDHAIQVNSRD